MTAYKVYFKASVGKDFTTIPKKDLKKILKRIEGLAENSRPIEGYSLRLAILPLIVPCHLLKKRN